MDGQHSSEIKKESELLREIKDIGDELKIIDLIYKGQEEVVQKLVQDTRNDRIRELQNLIQQCLEKVKTMQVQAAATNASVCIIAKYSFDHGYRLILLQA
jgi:23S rRNA C2498 (ribose-2'-O)-methylase RlmM